MKFYTFEKGESWSFIRFYDLVAALLNKFLPLSDSFLQTELSVWELELGDRLSFVFIAKLGILFT